MSFNPTGPVLGPVPGQVPGPVQGQPPRSGPGQAGGGGAPIALIGAVAMLLMELVLLLLTLVKATNHLGFLANLFGFGDQWIDAPTQFTPTDVAICALLIAGIVGSQGGRTWGRTAIMSVMALTGYPMATALLSELRTSAGRSEFTQGHNLLFNLVMIVELLIAVGTLVAGLATSSRGGAAASGPMPGPMPGQAPMPMPGQPYAQQPAPGQPYAQQPPPGYAPPPAQPGYPAQQVAAQHGQPQQAGQPVPYHQAPPQPGPGQPPAPGYAPPPVPPQAGPIQQPTPTQEAMAYRPTQYSPPPG